MSTHMRRSMRLLGRSQTLRCLSSYKLAATRTHSLGIGDNLPPHRGRVAVAMSGGIDSSTAALLLQRQGFDCIGVFMTNWDSSDEVGVGDRCRIDKDKNDAREVCDRLGIPLVEVDFVKEYWNDVFQPFLHSYQTGRETPNPDVYCNRHIKFDAFLKYATDKLGVDFMATGHYARLSRRESQNGDHLGDNVRLMTGRDSSKDQSYFLSLVPSNALEKVLFPLGELTKLEVRKIADEPFRGLSILSKKESMGVCFIGKRNLKDFLGQYIDFTPGRFIDADTNRIVGQHDGAEVYTTGQGARIGGVKDKYFVVGSSGGGDLHVVSSPSHPLLMSKQLVIEEEKFSWVTGSMPASLECAEGGKLRCKYKARYRQEPECCEVEVTTTSSNKEESGQRLIIVTFDNPQRAITVGQVLALYNDDECLGGGIITGKR